MDDDRGDEPGHEVDQEEPPLQDLVDRIREKDSKLDPAGQIGPGESVEDLDDVFIREQTDQVDIDAVWKAIESDTSISDDLVDDGDIDPEHVVEKKWYCEQCEYFSAPPEVHCTHEGTTIEEFIGTEKVRVRNCPVVAERMALGQFHREDSQ